MKTKLDKNGIEVYTIESKQDCIIALNNLKEKTLKNEHLHEFISQIDDVITAVNEDSFNILNNIKYKTKYYHLHRILYIFERDYLMKEVI